MNKVKNFFIWFFIALGTMLFFYALGSLLFYLIDQSWGFIAIVLLLAFLAGIGGTLKNE